jgi:hypothetical protein
MVTPVPNDNQYHQPAADNHGSLAHDLFTHVMYGEGAGGERVERTGAQSTQTVDWRAGFQQVSQELLALRTLDSGTGAVPFGNQMVDVGSLTQVQREQLHRQLVDNIDQGFRTYIPAVRAANQNIDGQIMMASQVATGLQSDADVRGALQRAGLGQATSFSQDDVQNAILNAGPAAEKVAQYFAALQQANDLMLQRQLPDWAMAQQTRFSMQYQNGVVRTADGQTVSAYSYLNQAPGAEVRANEQPTYQQAQASQLELQRTIVPDNQNPYVSIQQASQLYSAGDTAGARAALDRAVQQAANPALNPNELQRQLTEINTQVQQNPQLANDRATQIKAAALNSMLHIDADTNYAAASLDMQQAYQLRQQGDNAGANAALDRAAPRLLHIVETDPVYAQSIRDGRGTPIIAQQLEQAISGGRQDFIQSINTTGAQLQTYQLDMSVAQMIGTNKDGVPGVVNELRQQVQSLTQRGNTAGAQQFQDIINKIDGKKPEDAVHVLMADAHAAATAAVSSAQHLDRDRINTDLTMFRNELAAQQRLPQSQQSQAAIQELQTKIKAFEGFSHMEAGAHLALAVTDAGLGDKTSAHNELQWVKDHDPNYINTPGVADNFNKLWDDTRDKPWYEVAGDWVCNHAKLIAMGIGFVAGAVLTASIVGSEVGIPVMAACGIGLAGGTVAGATAGGLANVAGGRSFGTGFVDNLLPAAGGAFAGVTFGYGLAGDVAAGTLTMGSLRTAAMPFSTRMIAGSGAGAFLSADNVRERYNAGYYNNGSGWDMVGDWARGEAGFVGTSAIMGMPWRYAIPAALGKNAILEATQPGGTQNLGAYALNVGIGTATDLGARAFMSTFDPGSRGFAMGLGGLPYVGAPLQTLTTGIAPFYYTVGGPAMANGQYNQIRVPTQLYFNRNNVEPDRIVDPNAQPQQ